MSAGGTLYFLSKYFQSTLPYGMRHKKRSPTVITVRFQSTHPLRDATCGVSEATVSRWISIHAPLTGCDVINIIEININIISIHAPLTGCDNTFHMLIRRMLYFNPRTPYGMRRSSLF